MSSSSSSTADSIADQKTDEFYKNFFTLIMGPAITSIFSKLQLDRPVSIIGGTSSYNLLILKHMNFQSSPDTAGLSWFDNFINLIYLSHWQVYQR